jgi:glutamate 5-kinase
MSELAHKLQKARRVVVKLGTNTVTATGGQVCYERLVPLVRALADERRAGRQVVLVSSGAVGLGAAHLGLSRARLKDVATKQACAAVGQSRLMHTYEQLFFAHGVKIAQVLLTEDDFTERARYRNLRATMERLLKLGVVPIVNENDTVSVAELETVNAGGQRVFSDNDRLAALVASELEAELLILLTNVDGLLAQPPDTASLIPLVEEITPALRSLAAGPAAGGRGGMATKLEAAEIATHAGSLAVIANGSWPDVVGQILRGEQVGTNFLPAAKRMRGKQRWIAFAGNVRARIVVNEGARAALLQGKASLLSSGVVCVENDFAAQDVVSIVDTDGHELARGLASGDSSGWRKTKVLVSRDNIVLRNL